MIIEWFPCLWQIQFYCFVSIILHVAQHWIAEAAHAVHWVTDFGFVLWGGDMTAEVHLLQLEDILELLDAFLALGDGAEEMLGLLLFLGHLLEELLLHAC